jgi:hypothetical protein
MIEAIAVLDDLVLPPVLRFPVRHAPKVPRRAGLVPASGSARLRIGRKLGGGGYASAAAPGGGQRTVASSGHHGTQRLTGWTASSAEVALMADEHIHHNEKRDAQ